MTTERWSRQEAWLHERRAEIARRLVEVDAELDRPTNPDDEDRATEREEDQVLEDLGAAGLLELRAIDHALDLIRDGRYGTCQSCGDPIAPARLDAVPTASLCAECA